MRLDGQPPIEPPRRILSAQPFDDFSFASITLTIRQPRGNAGTEKPRGRAGRQFAAMSCLSPQAGERTIPRTIGPASTSPATRAIGGNKSIHSPGVRACASATLHRNEAPLRVRDRMPAPGRVCLPGVGSRACCATSAFAFTFVPRDRETEATERTFACNENATAEATAQSQNRPGLFRSCVNPVKVVEDCGYRGRNSEKTKALEVSAVG